MKENQIEIIKKVRAIENEMSKRRGLDRLVNYNSGEVVHKKQMEFHSATRKIAGFSAETEREKPSAARSKRSGCFAESTPIKRISPT